MEVESPKDSLRLFVKEFVYSIVLLVVISVSSASAQILPCTLSKVTTLPFAGDYGSIGQFAVTRNSITNPGAPLPVSVFVPSNATAQNRVPVIFFSHGFGGIDFRFYEALLRQLSSNGYIVVFSPYSASVFDSNATRYNQLFNGFLLAVSQYGNLMDTSRAGFAGHSYGAGATPEMLRRGIAQGWGASARFMFIMAPWYNWGTNLNQIPATTKMIVQVYWDDGTNEHLIGQNDIWDKLTQITDRKWQVIRASQTYCRLEAGHSLPVTDGLGQTAAVTDAYDAWGIWRRLHALAVYSFNGNLNARNVAYGSEANMGRWRGIFNARKIAPLEPTDSPVLNTTSAPTFRWSQKCLYADLGTPCP